MHFGSHGKLKADTSYTITSTYAEMDTAIEQGLVRPWKSEYVPLHKRYALKYRYLNLVRAHSPKLFKGNKAWAARSKPSTTMVAAEINAYYQGWPRILSDDALKAREMTAATYASKSQKARKAAWASKRGRSAYALAVRCRSAIGPCIAMQSAPVAALPAAAALIYPIVPTVGKALAGLLFVEVFAVGDHLRFFILEQLTLPDFRRRGVMGALMHAMCKVAKSVQGVDDTTGVDLVVRRKAKQQNDARSFDDTYGFDAAPDKCLPNISPDPVSELYLGSSIGRIGEVQLRGVPPEIVCRRSFSTHGFTFERAAARALHRQHKCPEGDNADLCGLVPRNEAREPLVLFAFF